MISQNIFSLRTRLGMTQEALAQKIGVARQTVARWESGDAIPDLDNASRLARVFGIDLDSLVRHDEKQAGYPVPPRGLHIFGVVRMGERGQIVIPKKARRDSRRLPVLKWAGAIPFPRISAAPVKHYPST